MNLANIIRDLSRGQSQGPGLGELEAEALLGAILDGGVGDLELGAVLAVLQLRGDSPSMISGCLKASRSRQHTLEWPAGRPMPVVIPTYHGARHGINLTPLLAFLLGRFGIPVLLHGCLDSSGRVISAHVLRELGVLPASSMLQVRRALECDGLAFAPTAVFSPGLANLLALRARLGIANVAHDLVRMLDPFADQALLLAAATSPRLVAVMRRGLVAAGRRALVFAATEGEPHADPKKRPCIELIRDECIDVLFDAEHDALVGLPGLPEAPDAVTTARWTRSVLDGETPVPLPILNQVAACLYGNALVADLTQAKARVAIELHAHSSA